MHWKRNHAVSFYRILLPPFPSSFVLVPPFLSVRLTQWHVGQRPEFLPTNRGFDYYYGIPFSVDMGDSYWDNNTQTPLPLLENTTIIEQPVNLATLSPRYIAKATAFMQSAAARNAPFFLYMAHNHVHVPMFCSQQFCNTSLRGPYGDNMAELDNEVGQLVDAIQALGADNNTLMIFTSDNGPWLIEGLNGGSAGLLRDGKTTTWEGGVRVPAIARWPGRIAPGRVTAELASTMDVFTTTYEVPEPRDGQRERGTERKRDRESGGREKGKTKLGQERHAPLRVISLLLVVSRLCRLALAGVAPPADRVIDGRDLSKVLFDPAAPSPHDCLFHYKGTSNRAKGQTGLWAVRCGNYKAHFVTNTYLDPIPVVHNPPLIFNIPFDPSETYPLSNSTAEYKAALATIQAAIAIHEATCPECAPNQMALGGNTTFAVCCDPNSKEKYPQFPACTCNPENWNPYNETTIAAHGARLSQYANHAW